MNRERNFERRGIAGAFIGGGRAWIWAIVILVILAIAAWIIIAGRKKSVKKKK